MKLVRTENAVGHVLCHDLTRILPGVSKGPVFRKGHIVREEDIPVLLSIGKERLYVWENDESMLHENDAADILRELCQGEHMRATEPSEGKIELIAEEDGLFWADVERLRALNAMGRITVAARFSGFPVRKGDKLCGMRVIPLVIEKETMRRARELAGSEPIFRLLPIRPRHYGLITTGNEVLSGRVEDRFGPVVKEKLREFGCEAMAHTVLGDDPAGITAEIRRMLHNGAQLVLVTGGMSVDPDDLTPLAIRDCGARIVSYGAPVLPGAMFLMSYMPDGRAVCGLPGCVMYARRTVFDLALPRILADVPVTAEWLAGLGNGGLCLNCPECRFPDCAFGKGV